MHPRAHRRKVKGLWALLVFYFSSALLALSQEPEEPTWLVGEPTIHFVAAGESLLDIARPTTWAYLTPRSTSGFRDKAYRSSCRPSASCPARQVWGKVDNIGTITVFGRPGSSTTK